MDWLNTMTKESVIYIAFESLSFGMPIVACPLWTDQGCNAKFVQDVWKIGVRVNAKSIASGVPIVACPIWNDQLCNAKLVQDVWKNGVRVNTGDGGIVERDGVERGGGGELRKNAKKWSDLAKEAMKKNDSSAMNLKTYANEFLLDGSW
uniref:Glycosyltransferase n=1 Tax=Solanum tuberosum TaxID=4113 RepID=M1BVP5_SOLTU